MPAERDHETTPEGEEAPPPGVKVMAIVRWLILGLTALGALGSFWTYARAQHDHAASPAAHAPKYSCPMHPQIVSDQPGECPICHMTLEPMPAERGPSPDAGPLGDARAPVSIPTAPKSKAAADAGSPVDARPVGTIPPGTAPIQLALDRVQAIGVRTAIAREQESVHPLRVTAVVAPPEQGAAEVHVRAAGFVERVEVSQTGVAVAQGQTLFILYSPEVFQAQSELLSTKQWEGEEGVRSTDRARRKLELLGMATKDVHRIFETGEPMRAIPIYASHAGYITKKNVVTGSYVTPEMTLYEIQDLSRVYIIADVPQRDFSSVRLGMEGRFFPTGHPEGAAIAKIDLIYPVLNAEARTTRVRMQVRNDKRQLLPGEYGTVELLAMPRKVLTVPRDADIDTGTATYVFVVQGDGRYMPRTVATGGAAGDEIVVEAGLSPGERVVSGATFLIDSESRLQAQVTEVAAAAPANPPGPENTSDGPSCDDAFDRTKYPDKYIECRKCTQIHHGMGSMEADCKNAIPKPWK